MSSPKAAKRRRLKAKRSISVGFPSVPECAPPDAISLATTSSDLHGNGKSQAGSFMRRAPSLDEIEGAPTNDEVSDNE